MAVVGRTENLAQSMGPVVAYLDMPKQLQIYLVYMEAIFHSLYKAKNFDTFGS
jgi:hypothetical protein